MQNPFSIRGMYKNILAACRETLREVKKMSASSDRLTTSVTAAIALIQAQSTKIAAQTTQIADLTAQIAAANNDAATEDALAGQLDSAVAANPV